MARISIWDLDFYHKRTFRPNYTLMKISSFHKQQGDIINFVTEKGHINMVYDKYYISREKNGTPKAPTQLTDRENVVLLGRGFRYHDNIFKMNEVIAGTRPDYNLYPEKKRDSFYNAEVLQLFYKDRLLEKYQPIENAKKYTKRTLVIDDNFWENDEKDIKTALEILQKYKRISFLHPIRIKILMENEEIRDLFLKLNFSRGSMLRWRNDFGSEYAEVEKIILFLVELKKRNKNGFFGKIPVKTVLLNHWEEDGAKRALEDLERCLKIVDFAKENLTKVLLIAPKRSKFETPYWYYFEILENWTSYKEDLSYLELMCYGSVLRWEMSWEDLLQDSLKWDLPNINFLLDLLANHPEIILKYGLRKNSKTVLNLDHIDFLYIAERKQKAEDRMEKKKLMFADIETTGFSRDWDDILEIAAIIVEEKTFKEIAVFHEYIKPSKRINAKITEITGITDEKVKDCDNEKVVIGRFFEWVKSNSPDVVVGHNYATFDGQFFTSKAKKYQYEDLGLEIVDTLKIAREKKIPVRMKTARGANSYTQVSLADYYGIEYQAHSAIEDVKALIQIYRKMVSPEQNIKEAREQLGF